MKFVWLIAILLLILFGFTAAANFLMVFAVGAVILLEIIAGYLVYEGIKKREWGSAFCWFIVFVVIMKVIF